MYKTLKLASLGCLLLICAAMGSLSYSWALMAYPDMGSWFSFTVPILFCLMSFLLGKLHEMWFNLDLKTSAKNDPIDSYIDPQDRHGWH